MKANNGIGRFGRGLVIAGFVTLLGALTAGATDLTWNNGAGTGVWGGTDMNWTGFAWTDGANALLAEASAAKTITLSGTVNAGAVVFGNAGNNLKYTLVGGAGASLAATSLNVRGATSNNGLQPTLVTTFSNLSLTVSGALQSGRANLVVAGASTVTAGTIGASSDWSLLYIRDSAVVTASEGFSSTLEAWGLVLQGGTLATKNISYASQSGGVGLQFDGGTVRALADTNSFIVETGTTSVSSPEILAGGLVFDTDGHAVTISRVLTGVGGLTKTGDGTLTLSAANTYAGGTTVAGGTLFAGSASPFGTGDITVADGATLAVTNAAGSIGDAVRVRVEGAGRLDLAAGVTETIGVLTTNGVTVASGTYTADTLPSVTGAGTLVVTAQDGVWSVDTDGSWSGAANWQEELVATGVNARATFARTAGGSVTLDGARTIGSLVFSNGNYTVAGTSPLTLDVAAGSAGIDVGAGATGTVATVLAGSDPILKTGTGTIVLSGANTFGGVLSITGGTVVAANNAALGTGGHNAATMSYIYNGATLALQGGITVNEHFHFWGDGVDGLGVIRNLSGDNALTDEYCLRTNVTIRVDGGSLRIACLYTPAGEAYSMTKIGEGTLTISSWDSYPYTGATLVNCGTLSLTGNGGNGVLRNTAIIVNTNATLTTTGDGTGLGFKGKPASLTLNGGTFAPQGVGSHIWALSGVTLNAGTMNGGFQWTATPLVTVANDAPSVIAGTLNLRTDNGKSFVATVADGGAATDLLVSATITTTTGDVSFTKDGAGTMVLAGTNTFTGAVTVAGGTLAAGTAGTFGPNDITVADGATLAVANPAGAIDDAASVVLNGAGRLELAAGVTETVLSLVTNGVAVSSGTYVAGTLPSVTGGGTLVIAGELNDGTWISDVDGTWSDAGNWQDGTIANGVGSHATFAQTTGVTVTLDNDRTIGNIAFSNGNYTVAGAFPLTLDVAAGSAGIDVGAGVTGTVSAVLAGTDPVLKTGPGALVLSGANTFSGVTTITGGMVIAESAAALGTGGHLDATRTLVTDGATLALRGGVSLGEYAWIAGDGVDGRGVVRSLSGTNALTDEYCLRSNVTIGVDADSLTAGYFGTTNSVTSYSLTKVGDGTLTVSKVSSAQSLSAYTGATIVDGGTLVVYGSGGNGALRGAVIINTNATLRTVSLSNGSGLGYNTGAKATSLTINGGTYIAESYGHIWALSAVTLGGGTVTGDVQWYSTPLVTLAAAEPSVIAGTVHQRTDLAATVADGAAATDLLFSATLMGGYALTKNGAGTMVLSSTNSYTGKTYVNAGTLVAANSTALGSGGHDGNTMSYIYNGATLALQGGITVSEHAWIWGAGVDGRGVIRSLSGDNALTDEYCLQSDVTIGVDADSLTANYFYTTSGAAYSFTKVGAGTLAIARATSGVSGKAYTGATVVDGGTLAYQGVGTTTLKALELHAGTTLSVATGSVVSVTSLVATAGSALRFGIGPVGVGGRVVCAGAVSLAGVQLDAATTAGYVPQFGDSFLVLTGTSIDTTSLVPPSGRWTAKVVATNGVQGVVLTMSNMFYLRVVDAGVSVSNSWIAAKYPELASASTASVSTVLAAAGANAVPVWQSYVLGLDPTNPASRVVCDAAQDAEAGSITLNALNVSAAVPADCGATVNYVLERSTDRNSWTACSTNAAPSATIALTGMAAAFFRFRADVILN